MPIYNNIRELRLSRKITQEDLAVAVKVSRQTIVAIEKGNYAPSLDLAMRLADFLKLKVEEIFYLK